MFWKSTLLLSICATACNAVSVTINGTASHAIPTTLYTAAALNAWAPVGSATIEVIADTTPVSSALPNSLQLTVPAGASGNVGFGNSGFFGININSSWTYNASFFYRFPSTTPSTNLTASINLQTSSGTVLGTATAALVPSTTWTQVFVRIKPTASASDANNNFTVTFSGAQAAGRTVNFAMFSLFPPTFKGRVNGMRMDIAETLASMAPSFFRLPGGNNLEGTTAATRWQWNATVGPLVDRPGRLGDWGYINTDGLGLLEYLEWCEDLNMEPILAVWDGYSLNGAALAEGQLDPYIQQAIDQINFAIGDPTTSAPAALRSSLGHPEPFVINHIEIGNEDFISSTASSTYASYRWPDFHGNLSAAFPQLRFLATSTVNSPALTPKPQEWDVHVYQTPSWFATNSFIYDSFARDGTLYFEGEYAAISTNANDLFGSPSDGRLVFPTMQSSTGEAAFMTGLERNSDIVFAASYAPLLGHVDNVQWTPNLVSFDSLTVWPSTSFYAQQMFSLNKGDSYLPSTLPSASGTIFWSVTKRNSPSQVLIKISNTVATSNTLTFILPTTFKTIASSGTAQILTGAQTASNSPTTSPANVVPVTSAITTGATFNFTAPGFSVSVLTIDAS
ncbi:glycoside hydrolase family 51 protein [Stereum hirsutum FP-91666 SS1]|uniref:glycoside hydrolase family 51 protein n=1 Tax=Stereum hirsutum (strain FP-91666) TaxID=721885 RepID=UPI00044106BB|nr:glycoside hydrolase family 51 protein [Stereum hirsutum FP-91666 SS1]EIM87070.1 glycoside hydrolase family 51 protein [Stereum hirsutum FP-91666 SS1]